MFSFWSGVNLGAGERVPAARKCHLAEPLMDSGGTTYKGYRTPAGRIATMTVLTLKAKNDYLQKVAGTRDFVKAISEFV
jgi:hypothetical protein